MSTNFPAAASLLIRRATVLGAGTMGSRIAAHLANAGIPTLLLDLVPAGDGDRNCLAKAALEALAKAKPAAFYLPSLVALMTPGNFEDDLPRLVGCDWVIEAVTENLAVKRALLERVLPHLAPHALLTSNTSGLPIAQIAAGLASHRERFFGSHFFNPPRYMQLLEVIPTAETDPAVVAAFAAFADRKLGKQAVFARDTPNFIANRIGVATVFNAAALMLAQGLTIEEVDALTGKAIGWPRTGVFRLADMVGIDVIAQVATNFPQGVTPGGFSRVLEEMVRRGWIGDKSGQGFYKKECGEKAEELHMALNLSSYEYRSVVKAKLLAVEMAENADAPAERLRQLLANDPAKDRAAAFLWPFLSVLWKDAASLIGDAASDPASIDCAMRAGFNWELGPFEMWDAAGVAATVGHMKALGLAVSPRAEALLAAGHTAWYGDGQCFQPERNRMEAVATVPGHARVAEFRRSHGVVRSNPSASLVDLGDGIVCFELHSHKNALGGDVLALLSAVLHPASDLVREFAAFVIASDRADFTVGANLMQLLLTAQEGEWEELAVEVRSFQQMTSAIKYCPRPVVVAPLGRTLGGGAEICLHAARRQAYAESYIGLVEAQVGLIPAGGGTKEMLLRAIDAAAAIAPPDPRDPPSRFAQSAEVATALRRSFETIALAKVSSSAAEARVLGLLDAADGITMNRERLLLDAKAKAAMLAQIGYMPPQPLTWVPAPGASALATLETGAYPMGEAGYASEHDRKVARWVAYILCGGRVTAGTLVSEEYLQELEREAFLSLCGEPKTQERIAFTLKTGKPLRN
ncbi:MAG: 3-hydroxyacyl-CoA dehydrogenase NAD-binding domain-containing protein [Terracidiphilus sp.]|jgi:3-hydroxyacyl-CoA dehydrogenase